MVHVLLCKGSFCFSLKQNIGHDTPPVKHIKIIIDNHEQLTKKMLDIFEEPHKKKKKKYTCDLLLLKKEYMLDSIKIHFL